MGDIREKIQVADVELCQDDPQFRITPTQQMAAACTGALITSLISECALKL